MRYTKLFNNQTEYNTYKNSSLYIKPNISYYKEDLKDILNYNSDTVIICLYDVSTDKDVSIYTSSDTKYISELYIDNEKQNTITPNYYLTQGIHKVKFKMNSSIIPSTFLKVKDSLIYCKMSNGFSTISSFQKCPNLETLILPNNFTTIPSDFLMSNQKITSFEIPEGVTNINSYAFRFNTTLTSITIPNSLTTLNGYRIFDNASNLKTVNIKNINRYININISESSSCPTYVGAQLFCNGEEVTKVYMDVVKPHIFYNCKSIKKVILRDGITSIGANSFCGCSKLTDINLPSSIQAIGLSAFKETRITSAVIPYGVTEIPQWCFHSNPAFKSVTIPETVTKITDNAFYNCNNLTTVYIQNIDAWCRINFNHANQVYTSPLAHDNTHLYLNGEEVTEVVVPNDVTKLDLTFNGANFIKSIQIPESVTEFGYYTFANCRNLKNINIPSSITSISIGTFFGCSALRSIELPANIESIANNAFYGCSSLIRFVIHTVTPPTLGTQVFKNARVSYIYVPDESVDTYKTANGWSDLANRIYPISNITNETIIITKESNAPVIKRMYDLYYCVHEDYMTSEEAARITSLPKLMYYNNKQLTHFDELQYFTNLTSLGNEIFRQSALETITLPSSLTTIGTYCFYSMPASEIYIIPQNVTDMGAAPFYRNPNLVSLIMQPVNPPTITGINDLFKYKRSDFRIYVPNNSVTNYKSATTWSVFESIILPVYEFYPEINVIDNIKYFRFTPGEIFIVKGGGVVGGGDQIKYYNYNETTSYDFNRLWDGEKTYTGFNATPPKYFTVSTHAETGYIYNSTRKIWLFRGTSVDEHLFDN